MLVEYGDFECPYSGQAFPIVLQARRQLGSRLRFVFRHFPLAEIHPRADAAAQAAEAAALQGRFWEMHDRLYQNQQKLSDDDLVEHAAALRLDVDAFAAAMTGDVTSEHVRADFMSGVRSGVEGTPTFFIGGQRWDGPWWEPGALVGALEQAAEQASPPSP